MSVLLKNPIFDHISNRELAQQLEARKKCEKKLPTWFGSTNIYYPKPLNIEQTSSEKTARYKAQIVRGKSLFDATGGWGVDSYFFSRKFEEVVHCEIDSELSEIASHNFGILGVENIKTVSQNGIDLLKNSKAYFDWIYVDPSRRNDSKGKVFRLADCTPDIPKNVELLFSKSDHILLKTSPLLDFSIGIAELNSVKEIHVVAVNNEVKELLWILEKEYSGGITIKTIHFSKKRTQTFDYQLSEEKNSNALFSTPLSYIYEPNAAILKSGAFKLLGNRFGLKKLHAHTHLYTSENLIDFPGRRFRVSDCIPYTKKNIKALAIEKANISTRNFPESVREIRKKFKIADGGNRYLFFVTDADGNRSVLICLKA
ncbi:MAG: class I SAM-dependent methyltransferase [Pricia sp.]